MSKKDKSSVKKPIVREEMLQYLGHLRENSKLAYCRIWASFIDHANKDTDKIEGEDVKSYIKHLELRKAKNSTINTHINALSSMFRLLYEHKKCSTNPVADVEKYDIIKKEMQETSPARYREEVAGCEIKKTKEDRSTILIDFIKATHLRCSEIARIKNSHLLNFKGFYKIVVMKKNNQMHEIYVEEKLIDRIKILFKGKVYLFETKKGKIYHRNAIYRMIQSKIKHLTPEKRKGIIEISIELKTSTSKLYAIVKKIFPDKKPEPVNPYAFEFLFNKDEIIKIKNEIAKNNERLAKVKNDNADCDKKPEPLKAVERHEELPKQEESVFASLSSILKNIEERLTYQESLLLKNSLKDVSEWDTIAGYAQKNKIDSYLKDKERYAYLAIQKSKEKKIEVKAKPNPTYGKINLYHVEILNEVFKEKESAQKEKKNNIRKGWG